MALKFKVSVSFLVPPGLQMIPIKACAFACAGEACS